MRTSISNTPLCTCARIFPGIDNGAHILALHYIRYAVTSHIFYKWDKFMKRWPLSKSTYDWLIKLNTTTMTTSRMDATIAVSSYMNASVLTASLVLQHVFSQTENGESVSTSSIASGGGVGRGQSAPLTAKKLPKRGKKSRKKRKKNQEKEEKLGKGKNQEKKENSGRKGKNREGYFPMPLLTDGGGGWLCHWFQPCVT